MPKPRHVQRWSDAWVAVIIVTTIATTRVYVGANTLTEGVIGGVAESLSFLALLWLRDLIASRFFAGPSGAKE